MSRPWVLDHAPYTPFMEPRLAHPPGLSPLGKRPLRVRNADFAAQLAERRRLLAEQPEAVLACLPEGAAAAQELAARFRIRAEGTSALAAIGAAGAEDWCLLLPDAGAGEYRLVGAVLCFPSRWSLAEKMGRPLTEIHGPVPDYDGTLAQRVNRVFETLRPDAGLWRVNWLVHDTDELHLPLSRKEKAGAVAEGAGPIYLRTERQTLTRLPKTGAAAFGITTAVCALEALTPNEAVALAKRLAELSEGMVAYRGGARIQMAALARLAEIAGQPPRESPFSR